VNAVSDSSPLHYLILVGKVDLLHVLFDTVVIPNSVRQELECSAAPIEVRQWLDRAVHGPFLAGGSRPGVDAGLAERRIPHFIVSRCHARFTGVMTRNIEGGP